MSFVKKYKKIIFIIIPVIATFLIIITLTNKNLIARLKGVAYAEAGFSDQNFYNCVVEAYNSVNYGNVIETETHEDEATEEPIEDELGESVRKYGYYTVSDVLPEEGYKNIKNLYCSWRNIKSADGISKLSNLENLELSGNQDLNYIDLSNNSNLKYINLQNQNLSSIDLSNMPNLESLYLNNNKLTSINLSNNTNLKYLDISSNNITEIDLSSNILLESVNLSNNKTEVLGFTTGKLDNVDLSQNTNLKRLTFENMGFKSIDLTSYPNIEELDLSDNNLTSIDLSQNTNLKRLDLSSNKITSIDLNNNTLLEDIDLSGNKVTFLWLTTEKMENFDFAMNPNLKTLKLNNMGLTEMDLSPYQGLETIELEYNKLTNVTLGQNGNLRSLYLRANKLTSIDLSGLSNLNYLSLDDNLFENINLSSVPSLNSLSMYDNKLNSITFGENSNLSSLYLDNNKLSNIDVSGLSNLNQLRLYNNLLESIDLSNNYKLSDLSLENNKLTSLDLSNNPNVQGFYVSRNQLNSITLGEKHRLNYAYLNDNKLTEIDLSEVSNCSTNYDSEKDDWYCYSYYNTDNINLSNNQISEMTIGGNTRISNLNLDGNPILKKQYLLADKEQELPDLNINATNLNKRYNSYYSDYIEDRGGTYVYNGGRFFEDMTFTLEYYNDAGAYVSIPYTARVYTMDNSRVNIDFDNKVIDCNNLSIGDDDFNFNTWDLYGEVDFDEFLVRRRDNNEVIDRYSIINATPRYNDAYYQAGFTDKRFYGCVVESYNKDFGTSYIVNERLSDDQIGTVTSLHCENKLIKYVDNLGKMPNLGSIYLSRNRISEIDFSNASNLRTIDVSNNSISTIKGLNNNRDLVELNASYNELSSINLSHNKDLVTVDVSGNKLKQIDVSQNDELVNLYANENNLTNINIENNKNLSDLSISYNNIRKLEISGSIAKLRLSNNKMNELVLGDLPNLEELYASDNNLDKLEITGDNKLKILDLHNNNFSTINLEKIPNLQFILLWGNPADDIKKYYMIKGESIDIESKVTDDTRRKTYSFTKNDVVKLKDNKLTALKVGDTNMKESFFDLLTYQEILKEPFKYCSKVFELTKISSNDYYEECDSLIKQVNDEVAFTTYKSTYEIHVYDIKSSSYDIDKVNKIIDFNNKNIDVNSIELQGENLVGEIKYNRYIIKNSDGYIIDSYKLINYKNESNNSQTSVNNIIDDIEKTTLMSIYNSINKYNNSQSSKIKYQQGTSISKNKNYYNRLSSESSTSQNNSSYNSENLKDTIDEYVEVNPQYKRVESKSSSKIIDMKYIIIGSVLMFLIGIFIGKRKKQKEI